MFSQNGITLPSKHFYTLKEAAAELNLFFNRTDIDENYIIHLGSSGHMYLHTLFIIDKNYSFVPFSIENFEENNFIDAINCFTDFMRIDDERIFLEIEQSDLINFLFYEERISVLISNIYQPSRSFNIIDKNLRKFSSFVDIYENAEQKEIAQEIYVNYKTKEVSEDEKFKNNENFWTRYWFPDVGLPLTEKEVGIELLKEDIYILNSEINILKNNGNRRIFEFSNYRFKLDLFKDENLLTNRSKGVSSSKRAAQQAAKTLAIYLWQQDKEQQIKIKDMAINVYGALYNTEHTSQLPDKPESLKDWIKDVAPEYARSSGRPPGK